MEEIKDIDQSVLAKDINDKLDYSFREMFLVKPLDVIKVKKEFSKPVANDAKPKKDDNDVEAVDYDKVETEVKEVDSDFRTGIVISVPYGYKLRMNDEKYPDMPINIGDKVVYFANRAKWFDLLKDSQLLDSYSIVGVVKD